MRDAFPEARYRPGLILARPLIIGVGNPLAGDDGAGPALVHVLRTGGICADLAETRGEATRLMALMDGRAEVILIDTSQTGAAPGSILRFDVAQAPLPAFSDSASSHGFGLHEALELARSLGTLPARCEVIAIEGQCFDTGTGLSDAVRVAVDQLAKELLACIKVGAADRPV